MKTPIVVPRSVPDHVAPKRAARSTVPTAASTTSALPEVLTAAEVAKLLRLNRKSIYAAVERGELPGVQRIGRKLRFGRDAVLAWLAAEHTTTEANHS